MPDTPLTPVRGSLTIVSEAPRWSNPLVAVPANNAISISGSLTFSRSTARASLTGSARVGQAGEDYIQTMVTVGTTEEVLDVGAIGTIGWCVFRNASVSNFILLGSTPGVYTLKVDAGTINGPVQWFGTEIYAKSDTASSELEYLAIER